VLSLTDRLDTVCGCFSAGLIPSGSKDPFAVRRQGNGILKILIDHQIHASLSRFIDWSLAAFPAADAGVGAELNKFLEGRLRFLLDEMKYSYDTVNAALAAGLDDPVDAVARVRALQEMRREPEFLALSTSFKRVMNIIGDAAGQRMEPDAELLQEGAEKALWSRCLEIRPLVEDAGRQHRYPEALRLMASLRGDVDRFFTDVLVMAEDPALRANRLALLAQLARLFLSVADISQIAVEGSA
jgi:glycyl-tRNA synthetase beta chain